MASGYTIEPARFAEVITDTNTTHKPSRGILIGVEEQMDFSINDSWVAFPALPVGTIIPLAANGARDSGDAAPDAGQIIFLQ